jgi:hypothetical protein
MSKPFAILVVFLFFQTRAGISEVNSSDLSKQELQNLLREVTALKARVDALERDLRNRTNRMDEDRSLLLAITSNMLVTHANLGTVTRVVESFMPGRELVSIPTIRWNREYNKYIGTGSVFEHIGKSSLEDITKTLETMMLHTWSGLLDAFPEVTTDQFEMEFYMVRAERGKLTRSLFANYKNGKFHILDQ